MYLPGAFQVMVAAVKDEPKVSQAFRDGKGVPWHAHDPELFAGTERFFRPGYAADLVSAWIPALDGVQAKLEAGAQVGDVGCGHGASTLIMAQSWPNATMVGFDSHPPSVRHAQQLAANAGLAERCRFEVASASAYPGAGYDLVTIFDASTTWATRSGRPPTSTTAWPRTGPCCWSSPMPTIGWRTT
jgi:SAM-dependent methyltransferase